MLGAGVFVFVLIAIVIGVGALQQFVLKPRAAVATVNGDSIQRQWYDKNLAYRQFVLNQESQNLKTQYQALVANQQANAAATATASATAAGTPAATSTPTPSASDTPAPSGAPGTAAGSPAASGAIASGNPAASAAGASASAEPSGTATATFTPTPTFNPTEQATVGALTSQFTDDQTQLQGAEQGVVNDLIDFDIMRQNAGKFGITVSNDEVSAQAKKTTDQIGGDSSLKQLMDTAHLSQDDFNQIQYNIVLKSKFQAYFADHPDQAPTPTPTPIPSPTTAPTVTGPQPPTPTAIPTPAPTPGADTLDGWLQEQVTNAKITRASFPLPSN